MHLPYRRKLQEAGEELAGAERKRAEDLAARDLTIKERDLTIATLRLELDKLREDSKKSLAHLCRIRELEQEVTAPLTPSL